jgi:LPXTG-motif cell wall-anchored protein
MKKKIIAAICAVALTLSLPMLAWGADSPSNEQATSNDVVLNVSAGSGTIASVDDTSTQASNTQVSANDEVLASFEVKGNATDVTLSFNIGTQWAGYTVRVYIQHEDGTLTTAIVNPVPANGIVQIHVDRLSIFTLVVDKTSAPSTSGSGTDTGGTSPKTGVDTSTTTAVVAGVTIAMAIAAACVAVALRKKVTQ